MMGLGGDARCAVLLLAGRNRFISARLLRDHYVGLDTVAPDRATNGRWPNPSTAAGMPRCLGRRLLFENGR